MITLERSILLGAASVTTIVTRSPVWLVLGGAACALLVVLEKDEARRALYALPEPGLDDLVPRTRRLAAEGFGAAQALLNAIAALADERRDSLTPVATNARRLAALHAELVRSDLEPHTLEKRARAIACALELAREAVLASDPARARSGEAIAAELAAEIQLTAPLTESAQETTT